MWGLCWRSLSIVEVSTVALTGGGLDFGSFGLRSLDDIEEKQIQRKELKQRRASKREETNAKRNL